MDRYAIIDSANRVINVTLWDGVTEWSPVEGLTAVRDTDPPTAEVGAIYSNGNFTPPVT